MRLPQPLQAWLERAVTQHLEAGGGPKVDFRQPPGEPGLVGPDSISWRVFRNPVALYIGGITAVLLELAEPRVRTGVWEHTVFRTDPLTRMRRTGLAAMVTVYGPRSVAEPMIAGVCRMHERVQGVTPDGVPYRADDPELLLWVHATAAFGFLQAYHSFVRPLLQEERDRFYAEGPPVARLYGIERAPASEKELEDLFKKMLPRLEPSGIIFEFLEIMRRVHVLPPLLRPLNGLFINAAVELTPMPVRQILGLENRHRLRPWQALLLRRAGAVAERIQLDSSPAAQACIRLGLSPAHLIGKPVAPRSA
jgi:uncharacterized protein (DUF2236 family)